MRESVEFLVGLLERNGPSGVALEDFDGVHGDVLQSAQEAGFLERDPGVNPVCSCPHCGDGVPYRLGSRFVCNHCRSRIDPRQMFLWGLDRERFLRWFAEKLHLRGDVRRLDENLWQLGAWSQKDGPLECFFQRGVFLSPQGRMRITAYCNALVLYGLTVPSEADCPGRRLSLLEVLRWDGSFTVTGLASLPPARGIVRFDTQSGALWAGDTCLGEVRVGSKEFFFLDCLAKSLDRFVPYADIKQFVLSRSGSRDATEEATFCQGLKSRIKKKWIARIDELIVTTNKGDGYRLRGYTGP